MAERINEQDVNSFRQNVSGNMDYLNNSSFMIARIDTSPLMLKIRKDIGGKEVFLIQDADIPGGFREEEKQIGNAMANEEGVMRICNMTEEIVNQHTVQGNLKGEHYWDFISRFREEVTDEVTSNCYDWGIRDKDLDPIINKLCRLVELFLTRPIDDKERQSYQKEFQSKEVIQTQAQKQGALSSFGHTK